MHVNAHTSQQVHGELFIESEVVRGLSNSFRSSALLHIVLFLQYQRVGRLYVGMTRTCLGRHTYEKLTTAPTLHLLAFLGSRL